MTLSAARAIADSIVATLTPVTERILIAGSIRRGKSQISDIDIVCVPRRDQVRDMFQQPTGFIVIPEFISTVNQWTKVKGEPYGKMTSRIVDGHKVELYMADANNFGAIALIRTGNADFTHMIMKRVLKCGLEQRDGYLWDGDKQLAMPEEIDYFRTLNLPYIEPENRDAEAFRKLSSR